MQFPCYADDTSLYSSATTIKSATDNLQLAFNALQYALFHLKLVLNTDKTKYTVFSRARETDSKLQIYSINGTPTEKVPHYKYLGVCIDDKFTFYKSYRQLV